MIKNVPLKTLEYAGLTIEGYSRAAVQTYWRVPEMKLGFDLGAHPWSFMGTGTWFISHGHLDHIAALPLYIARRRMMKMDPPTIYLPEETLDPVQQILQQFTRLDKGRMPCSLKVARPGDEIELSRELVVNVVATKHSVPSLGFIVSDRRRKLKPEYQNLTGSEIRDVRLSGVDVTEERRVPQLAYLGDSAPVGLDNNPAMYEARILIMEMTFVAAAHRRDKVRKFGHIHLDDILERRDKFKNELIIASHFSTRYSGRRVHEIVAKELPDMLDGRLHLWI